MIEGALMTREIKMKPFDPNKLPDEFCSLFRKDISVLYCELPYKIAANDNRVLDIIKLAFSATYIDVEHETNHIFVYVDPIRSRTFIFSFQSYLYAEITYSLYSIPHYVIELMQIDLIQDSNTFISINGTALTYKDNVIVLCAIANSGKTTLAIDFMENGAKLISDISFLYNVKKILSMYNIFL